MEESGKAETHGNWNNNETKEFIRVLRSFSEKEKLSVIISFCALEVSMLFIGIDGPGLIGVRPVKLHASVSRYGPSGNTCT